MAGYPDYTPYHITTDEIIDVCKRQGVAFEVSVDLTLAGNGTLKTVFITGERPVIFYSRKISYNGSGINALIYRDPVYTGGTELLDINNPNDINGATPLSKLISGATITDDGILSRAPVYVFGSTTNSSEGESLQTVDDPQIIPPNSTILLVFESRDSQSQDLAAIAQWVEPTRIPGLVLNNDGTFDRYNGKSL